MEPRNYYFDSATVAPRVAPSARTRIIRYMPANILLIAVASILALLAIGVVWSWSKLLFTPIEETMAARCPATPARTAARSARHPRRG